MAWKPLGWKAAWFSEIDKFPGAVLAHHYLRQLVALGAIVGGRCWADPDLNTPDVIALGKVYFNFDFTPSYPAEHIVFRSQMTNDYLVEIF